MRKTKFIVVTGGVVSGLGKGIASASIGKLFSSRYKVVPMKLDGYLNVDPGTMNPVEHGEVFVLDDGGEVDMDFGHYERFLGVTCRRGWNLTMGKVFDEIRQKERRGDYLGKTVQYVPHVTDCIKERILRTADEEQADIMLIEVGGTVGDMENELYIEACRQLKKKVGPENILYVHLTYVPILECVKEQKSKPTQQSVALLRARGIHPDIIIGRCSEPLDAGIKRRIATFCDVDEEAVITGLDVESVYTIPFVYEAEGIAKIIGERLGLEAAPQLEDWERLLFAEADKELVVALCGKYTKLEDSYASVVEALRHAAAHQRANLTIKWIETTDIERGAVSAEQALEGVHGVIVPGGFGSRGIEGKIEVIRHCRESGIPYLGLCYGMQLAVIEYARNVCGLEGANSTEVDPATPHPVIDLLPGQRGIAEKGATMRLGGHDVHVRPGTRAAELFGSMVRLRFRHRYEVNPAYIGRLGSGRLTFSGMTPAGDIMQVAELADHPFFMGTQAHPELTSKLEEPSPFFLEFLKACGKELVVER